jgi:hypothetical protein
MFKGMTDRGMVAAWHMKKMTIALSLSFIRMQFPCPRAGYIDFGCLQPTPSFELDYSITASTKNCWPHARTSGGRTAILFVIIIKCNIDCPA